MSVATKKIREIVSREFYLDSDVVKLARNLLGKILVTDINGELTSGIICETEAYEGHIDKASHAYNGRRTARTETMYAEGGVAYIYLCYGIHKLFNIVTHSEGIPHAVLIRGILPGDGSDIMLKRRKKTNFKNIGIGPGNVTECLGITLEDNGADLTASKRIWVEDHNIKVPDDEVEITPRIGVDYADDHAKWPYRFVWAIAHR